MRLLICTQAVDTEDRVLGFFHSWIEEFSKHSEKASVICLKEGKHALPSNARVYSLGKERGKASRIAYAWRFLRYAWRLRNEYDAVFVHMNQEYVLLAGILWRLLGKRVVLWRNHRMGNIFTRVAALFADVVCHTSPDAFVASFQNAQKMPIGIDTEKFSPGTETPKQGSILFFGRLDPVKKPEFFLKAMKELEKSAIEARAHIYGDPTPGNEAYARALRDQFKNLPNISFHAGVPHEKAPELYRGHDIYVNTTPSGSFDKTIGEAMASGCLPVIANSALQGVVPDDLFIESISEEKIAACLISALKMSDEERGRICRRLRAYIDQEHSLKALVVELASLLRHTV